MQLFPLVCYLLHQACLKCLCDISETQKVEQDTTVKNYPGEGYSAFYPFQGQSADGFIICYVVTPVLISVSLAVLLHDRFHVLLFIIEIAWFGTVHCTK
jgi:hypothetical protein